MPAHPVKARAPVLDGFHGLSEQDEQSVRIARGVGA